MVPCGQQRRKGRSVGVILVLCRNQAARVAIGFRERQSASAHNFNSGRPGDTRRNEGVFWRYIPTWHGLRVHVAIFWADNRGNGAALNKLTTTKCPASAVIMEFAAYSKKIGKRVAVDWSHRAANQEAGERAFQAAKSEGGLPHGCVTQERRRPEELLRGVQTRGEHRNEDLICKTMDRCHRRPWVIRSSLSYRSRSLSRAHCLGLKNFATARKFQSTTAWQGCAAQ